MSNFNCSCNCNNNCTAISIVASLIIGIIAAFLRITAVITVTPAFLWVTLGIAVVYLAVVPVTSALVRSFNVRSCLCSTLPVLLIGILGTVLTSVILLAIPFVATSVVGAIITGALLLFFSLALTTTACLARCIAGCSED